MSFDSGSAAAAVTEWTSIRRPGYHRGMAASETFTLRNSSGLHARPASLFVQTVGRLASAIQIENLDGPGRVANAKSILEVLALGVSKGHRIAITVNGSSEREDLDVLARLIESGLGETLPEDSEG